MVRLFPFFLVILLLAACKDNSEKMLGTWQLMRIKVVMNSIDNGETGDTTMIYDSTNFLTAMRVNKSLGIYKADGRYTEQYYKDTLLLVSPIGNWHMEGDSLVQYQLAPEPDTSKHYVTFNGNSAKLRKMMDWDNTGVKNDYFEADLIKIEEPPKK